MECTPGERGDVPIWCTLCSIMSKTTLWLPVCLGLVLSSCGSEPPTAVSTAPLPIATVGTRVLEAPDGAIAIKILLESANLGTEEVELGEIEFPAGYRSQGHAHGSTEVFYVLSGELEHVVNGEAALVRPGEIGIVRPGDQVEHRVPGEEPCRVLVIWVPGGEADRLARVFLTKPIAASSRDE